MEQPNAYERQLAGAARRRLDGTGDGELAALLDHVAHRRSRRLGASPVNVPGAPATPARARAFPVAPVEPVSTDVAPLEAAPTGAAPLEAVPTDAGPLEAAPTDAGTGEALPADGGLALLTSTGPAPAQVAPAEVEAARAGPGSGPAGELLAIDRVGPDVACFVLRRPPGFSFRAGQNVKAGLPGRGRHRYSIASAPHDPTLELCIERVSGGRLTPSFFDLSAGGQIELADRAGGSFTLDERAPRHLMVATVTGIAPFRSMVRDARHRGLAVELTVLHGASHADELPYREELEALAAAGGGVRYVPTVSRPSSTRNAGWHGHTGRVDDLALELAAGFDPSATRVYACGNGGMVARVAAELGARGFRVSTESYD